MSALQEYHGVIGQPTPIVSYRNDDELLHSDGCLFALLCLGSWVLFGYLWARLHWINYLEKREQQQRLPAIKSEQWMWPHNWRN